MDQMLCNSEISWMQFCENQRREIQATGFDVRPQRYIEEHISGSDTASERPRFILLLEWRCADCHKT